MAAHNSLTGTQLHYPRGADTASSGDVFIADGAGGGSFSSLTSQITAQSLAPVWKYKDADTVVNNNATLADDDDLTSFSLAASTVYRVEGVVHFDSANGTTGAKLAFQLVSGSLTDSQIFVVASRPDNDSITTSGPVAVTDTVTIASPGGTSQVEVRISGFISVNNAAVLDLQIAQDSAAATDTTFNKGSYLTFQKANS